MKIQQLLVAAGASIALVHSANAVTINFDNDSGNYGTGITATVAAGGGSLHYNGVEGAVGVGSNNTNGAMGFTGSFFSPFTENETLTVTFNQEVVLNSIFFRQWENNVAGFGDDVTLSYSGGASGSGSVFFDDSGQGDGLGQLLDEFTPGISLTSFTLTPEQDGFFTQTAVYLHSVDVSPVPVPAAAWLFGSALLGLVSVRRRKT